MTIDNILSAVTSAGGMSVVMIALGRYFLIKLVKEFEKMSEDLNEIKTKIAIHEAMRERESSNRDEINDLKERLILADSSLKAAWRRIDDIRTGHK